jgi:hypothetical protein
MTGVADEPLPPEIAQQFSDDEFRDFLAPGLPATRAEPAFRERLRQKLWTLVQQGNGSGRDDRLD